MERRERASGASPGHQRARSPTGPRPGPTRPRASPAPCWSRPTCCPSASRTTKPAAARTAMRRRYRLRLRSPSTPVPQNGATHENPFLVPEAGRAEDASVPARTRLRPIARLLTGTLGRGLRRGDRHAHERFTRRSARERRRHLRWGTGMIAGVAMLGGVAVVVIEIAAGTGHPVAKAHHAGVAATASGQGAAWDSAAKLKVATVTRRERQASARTAARRAAKRQRQPRHETRRHPPASPRHRAPASSEGASPVGVQASVTSTGSSDSSNAPTAETARAITTAPVSAATTSTPPPPGPSGPGGTVGSNCNPKCS